MKTPANATKHVTQQIIILAIVLILVGVVAVIGLGGKKPEPQPETPIPTTFNENAAKKTESKDTNYPQVVPDNLGRPDPFAPVP
jgi:hypothetical protein